MKIASLSTAVLAGNFEWILVRIDTNAGFVGLGESYWGAGVVDVIRDLAPVIVGEDPRDVERLYTKMTNAMSPNSYPSGVVMTAISGVEIALWDLAGKILGVPVYRLLGGKYRDVVDLYLDCHRPDSYASDAWYKHGKAVRDKGYRIVKFDIDMVGPDYSAAPWNRALTTASVREMAGAIAALKDAVGSDIELAVDCHWQYNVVDAIRLAKALEPFDLLWLEDPIPPDNPEALARVAASTSVPICTGERLYTANGFRPFIEKGACSFVHPDIPRCGGLIEAKRIASEADLYYIPFAAHNVSSPIGTIASAHACAAIRNFVALEFHSADVPWWEDIVLHEDPIIRNGSIRLGTQPGLGVELNRDVCRAHLRAADEGFFD